MQYLKTHSLPIVLIAVSLMFALIGNGIDQWLQYSRHAISEGEYWRLFSGHLLHIGWIHLFLNQAALLIIWYFSGHFLNSTVWWGAALFSALGTSLCLYMFMPELLWYVGLSGVLHGLLAVGAVAGILRGSQEALLLLILIGVKVVWEQFDGALSSSVIVEGKIIVNAHLYGMLSGIVYITLLQLSLGVKSRLTGKDAG